MRKGGRRPGCVSMAKRLVPRHSRCKHRAAQLERYYERLERREAKAAAKDWE